MRKLFQTINNCLTESTETDDVSRYLDKLKDTSNRLQQARTEVAELEAEYAHAIEQVNSQLAVAIRRVSPGLQVGLSKGQCNVGYRSRSIALKPDMPSNSWIANGPDQQFVNRFTKGHPPEVLLMDNMGGLAKSLSDYFKLHYKSL